MIFRLTKNFFYTLLLLLQHKSTLKAVYDEQHLCGRYTCDGDRLKQPCSCDWLCEVYGDCCPDHIWGNVGDRHATESTDTPDHKPSVDPSLASCVDLRFSRAYLLVNRCPTKWKDEYVRDMCETTWPGNLREYLIPVTSNVTGLSYKNTYCAVCHGERLTGIHMWSYRLKCAEDVDIPPTLFMQLEQCLVVFKEPARRLCIGNAKRCPVDTNQLDVAVQNCNRFTDYVYVERFPSSVYYQNKYCVECNGLSAETSTCYDDDYIRNYPTRVMAMSSLADLTERDNTDGHLKGVNDINITLEEKPDCGLTIYSSGRCLSLQCPFGFTSTTLNTCMLINDMALCVCATKDADLGKTFCSFVMPGWSLTNGNGECEDDRETWRTLASSYVKNTDTLMMNLQVIGTQSGSHYNKLTIFSKQKRPVSTEAMTHFSRNCTTLNHTGTAWGNYDHALKFLKAMTGSTPVTSFTLTNERVKNSTKYHLEMEMCGTVMACKVLRINDMSRSDIEGLGDKVWRYGYANTVPPQMAACAHDIEMYEDKKRMDRNTKLIEFFVNQGMLENSAASLDIMALVIQFVSVVVMTVTTVM